MKKHSFAIIGNGYLSQIIIKAFKENKLPDFDFKGVYKRREEASDTMLGYPVFYDMDELLKEQPEFVIEAASKHAVYDYGAKVLNANAHLVLLSVGALANAECYQEVEAAAIKNDKKVYIAHGAVGGFDVINTIKTMGPMTTHLHAKKDPERVRFSTAYHSGLDNITEPTQIFKLTTREAYEKLPTHVNIAIATALAGSGIDETIIEMDGYPNFEGDEYMISVKGRDVYANINIYSKTPEIAAWSAVRVLNNAVSPFVF